VAKGGKGENRQPDSKSVQGHGLRNGPVSLQKVEFPGNGARSLEIRVCRYPFHLSPAVGRKAVADEPGWR
jgi:hypothetical protein